MENCVAHCAANATDSARNGEKVALVNVPLARRPATRLFSQSFAPVRQADGVVAESFERGDGARVVCAGGVCAPASGTNNSAHTASSA